MATTFEKLISLVAYDNALTERTDDFYLRAKTQPRTLGITEIARETARQLGKYGENPLGYFIRTLCSCQAVFYFFEFLFRNPCCFRSPQQS